MYSQIVVFKLKQDSSRELFLEYTKQMISWLQQQSGFVSYELYAGLDNWSDRIAWDNEEFALDGLKKFRETDIARKLIHLIDKDYNCFFGKLITAANTQLQMAK